jgi:hypothetical protein
MKITDFGKEKEIQPKSSRIVGNPPIHPTKPTGPMVKKECMYWITPQSGRVEWMSLSIYDEFLEINHNLPLPE